MSTEDLENFEADRELRLAQEYQDVVGHVPLRRRDRAALLPGQRRQVNVVADGARPMVEVDLRDAWVWDMYRRSRFVPSVRVVTFKDVNVEELPRQEL